MWSENFFLTATLASWFLLLDNDTTEPHHIRLSQLVFNISSSKVVASIFERHLALHSERRRQHELSALTRCARRVVSRVIGVHLVRAVVGRRL